MRNSFKGQERQAAHRTGAEGELRVLTAVCAEWALHVSQVAGHSGEGGVRTGPKQASQENDMLNGQTLAWE